MLNQAIQQPESTGHELLQDSLQLAKERLTRDNLRHVADGLVLGLDGVMAHIRTLPKEEQPYWLHRIISPIAFRNVAARNEGDFPDEDFEAEEVALLRHYGFDLLATIHEESNSLWWVLVEATQ